MGGTVSQQSESGESQFAGGSGTANDPYQIATAEQLEKFSRLVDGDESLGATDLCAILIADINLSGVGDWFSIGTDGQPYIGTFNGDGHTISGHSDEHGLFDNVGSGGTVKNLTVSGTVTGDYYVGGIVNENSGTIQNCAFSGSVSGTGGGRKVGGIVGWNKNGGTVTGCRNTGNISGSANDGAAYVGGVVGDNRGTVTNCYNTGNVSGGSKGGVVGDNYSSVTNCYYQIDKGATVGIGGTTADDTTTVAKTADKFHSGEVACLLGEAWGQNLMNEPKDNYPQLRAFDADTPQVYKVAFMDDSEEHDAKYANSGMTVDLPATEPTKEGYTFSYWQDKAGTQVTEPISVNSDTTYYAKWTEITPDPDPEPTPEPEPEDPPYSGKYSYEISTDIGDNGALSVDRYATEGDTVTIQVAPDQAYKLDDLSVTANGKEVELTANGDGTYTFTMPSADVKITATFAEDPDWTPDEPEEPSTDVSDLFIDIAANAWYKDAVQYAYDNGFMTDVSATEFAPEATTTRAMIVSILARLESVTSAEAAGFADVTDEWYATAVNWAANVGVVNGYEDGTFKPNDAITREQLAAILMNYSAYKGEDVSARADLTNYTDQPSAWAEETMSWAVAEGLISGVTNTELQPQGNATRAQVAAILQRFLCK